MFRIFADFDFVYFDGKVVGLEFDGKRNGLGWDGTVLGWNSGGCKDGGTDIATSPKQVGWSSSLSSSSSSP